MFRWVHHKFKYVGKLKVSSISEGLEKTQTYVENNN